MCLNVSDRTYILEVGRVAMQGSSRDILATEEIAENYLGGRAGGVAHDLQLGMSVRLKKILT